MPARLILGKCYQGYWSVKWGYMKTYGVPVYLYLLVLSSEQYQVSSLKREYAMEALQKVQRLLFEHADFAQAAGSTLSSTWGL